MGRVSDLAGSIHYNEPIEIKFFNVKDTKNQISEELNRHLHEFVDCRFNYKATEYSGTDQQEEDDDQQLMMDLLEKESPDVDFLQGIDPTDPEQVKACTRIYGEAHKYDIVELTENDILFPGAPDFGIKYREKLYLFRNETNAQMFQKSPEKYIPNNNSPIKIPPLRIFIVGPNASGKSSYAKFIAKKYGLFHFDFNQRLQELILSKIRQHVGNRFNEERELNRQKMIDIKRVCEELIKEDTDFRDLMGSLNSVSKELQESGENGAELNVTDIILRQQKEEDSFGDSSFIPAKPQLDEFLEGIVSHLESEAPLEGYHLEPILSDLWKTEPFRSNGFVIEGFPKNNADIQWLEENGLLPDVCLILQAGSGECIERQLKIQTSIFAERYQLQLELKAAVKKKRQELRMAKIEQRRKEITDKVAEIKAAQAEKARLKEERKAAREATGSNNDDDDEEEAEDEEEEDELHLEDLDFEMDVDVQFNLDREFAEYYNENPEDDGMLGFDELESPEDAFDRLKSELEAQYEESSSTANIVSESCEEYSIPKIIIDTTNFRKDQVKNKILKSITNLLPPLRNSICESAYEVSEGVAENMINTGFAKMSPYGRFDALLLENQNTSKWHGAKQDEIMKFPVLYNGEIFYFDNPENRAEFMANPLMLFKKSTEITSVPFKVPVQLAILGPPKSGRTTLADRFAKEQNLERISLGEACRRMLAFYPNSSLSKRINAVLLKGEAIQCDLQIEAVKHWLLSEKCQTQGYVFDGFPHTRRQVELLSTASPKIIPYTIIELQCSEAESITRSEVAKILRKEQAEKFANQKSNHEATTETVLHDSPKIIELKAAYHNQNIGEIRDYYMANHQNWHTFDAKINRWKLWEEVKITTVETLENVQNFILRTMLDQAVCIKDLAVTKDQLDKNLSEKFKHLCPVALKEKGHIEDSSKIYSHQFTAQYQGTYYRLADDENLQKFLADPEFYIKQDEIPTVLVNLLPDDQPVENPSFGRFCPVSRLLTGDLVYGQPNIGAEYKGNNFIFASNEYRAAFVRQPENFSTQTLPNKIPPIPEIGENITPLKELPALGFLEQSVSKSVSRALSSLSQNKPKIPWLSIEQSALLYTATYLKAFNQNGSDLSKEKYRKQLEKINDQTALLEYLGNNMTRRFREPEQRPEGFDEKMDEFYSLRR